MVQMSMEIFFDYCRLELGRSFEDVFRTTENHKMGKNTRYFAFDANYCN